jgi:branched-chain amino acid transport system permease protein
LLGVLAAVGLSAAAGALLALPTLRLRGLHLALATLAFAAAMDGIFFDQRFGSGGSLTVDRVHIPGIPTSSDRAFLVLLSVVFAVGMVGLLALRRGRIGRRLLAISDSPQACATLGLNINWTKLVVLAVSAGMAGLGGALLGGEQHSISAMDVTQLSSLSLLLLLLVGGRSSASGALVGAAVYAAFPALAAHFSVLRNVQLIATGGAAILVCRHPEGIVGMVKDQFQLVAKLVNSRDRYASSRAIEEGHAQLIG